MTKKSSSKIIEAQYRAHQEELVKLALEAINRAKGLVRGDNDLIDELDKADVYLRMAADSIEISYRPGDIRRDAELKGSAKGVEKRVNGAGFNLEDILDEIRNIHKSEKSAEWHRRKLARETGIQLNLRTMQRHLKRIRNG